MTLNGTGETDASLLLRVMLAVMSVVSGGFGAALIVLGATQRFDPSIAAQMLRNSTTNVTKPRDFSAEAQFFNDPFVGIVALGAFVVVAAGAGLVGAALFSPRSEWRRSAGAIFAALSLLCAAGEGCLAVVFFVCGDLTVAYVRIYWPYIAHSVAPWTVAQTEAHVRRNLHGAGFVTLGAISMHIGMALTAALITGVCYAVKRLNVVLSVGLAAASAALFALCVFAHSWIRTHDASWVVVVLGTASVFTFALAVAGLLSAVLGSSRSASGVDAGSVAVPAGQAARRAALALAHAKQSSGAAALTKRRWAVALGAAQLLGLLGVALVVAVAAAVAVGVADSAHRGLAADVAAVEHEVADESFTASDDSHLETVAVAHFALVGVGAIMMALCLLLNALSAALSLLCVSNGNGNGNCERVGEAVRGRGAPLSQVDHGAALHEVELPEKRAGGETDRARAEATRSGPTSSTSEDSEDIFYDGSGAPAFREWD